MDLVYVIQRGERGPVKIGVARNPKARLVDLQVGNPEPLRLLVAHPGGRPFEQLIHATLAEYRLLGEWFAPHAEVERFVQGLRRNVSEAEEAGWCERCGMLPIRSPRRRYCSDRCQTKAKRLLTREWKRNRQKSDLPTETAICGENGGGGYRTRVAFPPDSRLAQGKSEERSAA